MDADVDVRKDTVWIISPAKPRDLAQRLPRAVRRMRKQMEQAFPFEKGIPAQTPLTEALAFLRDRYDLNFYIDTRAFRRAGVEDIGRRPVQLAPRRSETSLGMIVKELLDQAGATFVLRDQLILVLPAARK